MSNVIKVDELFQRSRSRVKGLGEVFTPEAYVEDMLKILAQDKRALWSDDSYMFFEPSCGHGNIVIAIYRKRLEAIYCKSLSMGIKEAAFNAVANSLNTLWAIDVDQKNVNQCRNRVLSMTIEFLKEKLKISDDLTVVKRNADFFAHVLSAIAWQIHENDTLSSLSIPNAAATNASRTKAGDRWLAQNGHKELSFENTWVAHYERCDAKSASPIEFERASKFIKNLVAGTARESSSLEFASYLISLSRSEARTQLRPKDTAVGL